MPSPVTLKIKFKSASLQQFIERYSVDISKGGIFIRTPKPLSVGTTLKFEFHLSDNSSLLLGNGTVVWVREPDTTKGSVSPGMGLRFDDLPAESQKVLEQILAQKKKPAEDTEQATRVAPEAASELAALTKSAETSQEKVEEETIEPAEPPALEIEDEDEDEDVPSDETEDERNERLSKIVLGDQTEETPLGSTPLDGGPEAIPDDAMSVSPQPQEEKSSGMIWLMVLIILGGAGFLYYQYVYQKPAPAQTPVVDMEVTQARDMEINVPEVKGIKMSLESTPPGARIIVEGADSGKVTPAELEGLDPDKEIKIDFDLSGKKLVTKVLKPTPDQPLAVNLDLPAEQKITFTSEPVGAMVIVNNLPMGKTPTRLKRRYRSGRIYKVEFKLAGYETFQTEIPGEPTWTREGEDEALVVHGTLEKKGTSNVAVPPEVTPAPKAKVRPKVRPKVVVPPKAKVEPKVEPTPPPLPKEEPKLEEKPKPKVIPAVKKPNPKAAAVKKPKWADEK